MIQQPQVRAEPQLPPPPLALARAPEPQRVGCPGPKREDRAEPAKAADGSEESQHRECSQPTPWCEPPTPFKSQVSAELSQPTPWLEDLTPTPWHEAPTPVPPRTLGAEEPVVEKQVQEERPTPTLVVVQHPEVHEGCAQEERPTPTLVAVQHPDGAERRPTATLVSVRHLEGPEKRPSPTLVTGTWNPEGDQDTLPGPP